MSKKIKTTWGKIFEKSTLMLFNEYPNILQRLGEYDELASFSRPDDEYDEIYQWYIIDGYTVDWLERFCPSIYEDIRYSDVMGLYIMPVRHWGTGWDAVGEELEIKDEDIDGFYKLYKKQYHDELPGWVKRNVFGEKEEQ